MLIRFLSLLMIVLALTSCVWSAAPVVTATYEPLSQGYLVRFVLHNTLQQEYITQLTVVTNDATDLLSPAGWNVFQNFRQVDWDTPNPSYQLQPGQIRDGFGFTSQNSPGTLNLNITSNTWSYNGSVTPTLVPEPSSILAIAGGIVGLGGLALRRRRENGSSSIH
jgi:hypothetical protein